MKIISLYESPSKDGYFVEYKIDGVVTPYHLQDAGTSEFDKNLRQEITGIKVKPYSAYESANVSPFQNNRDDILDRLLDEFIALGVEGLTKDSIKKDITGAKAYLKTLQARSFSEKNNL